MTQAQAWQLAVDLRRVADRLLDASYHDSLNNFMSAGAEADLGLALAKADLGLRPLNVKSQKQEAVSA